MKLVLFDSFYTDRLKGSQSDVEGDFCSLDAAVMKAGQNLRSEVEAGSRGGDRTALAGVDGLVAIAIRRGIGAGDVGWERHVADLFYVDEEIVDRGEADVALAEFAAGDDLGMEFVIIAEEKMLANSDFAAGAHETLPVVGVALQLPGEQDLDPSVKKIARGGIAGTEGLGL